MLAMACIALGGVLAWGFKERGERARLTERNRRVEDAYTFVLAKRNDLATFLTHPGTELVRLEGRGAARGLNLTIAWQEERRSGVLIADSMPLPPDGAGYVIWALPQGSGKPVRCDSRMARAGMFSPEAGVTSFEFRAPDFAGPVDGFVVTEETSGNVSSPGKRVVYESGSDKRV